MLKQLKNKDKYTTLELVEVINHFRKDIEFKKPIMHKNLLKVIRQEFEMELEDNDLLPSYYQDSSGKVNVMYELAPEQALQILLLDSVTVRRASATLAISFDSIFEEVVLLRQREIQQRGWK